MAETNIPVVPPSSSRKPVSRLVYAGLFLAVGAPLAAGAGGVLFTGHGLGLWFGVVALMFGFAPGVLLGLAGLVRTYHLRRALMADEAAQARLAGFFAWVCLFFPLPLLWAAPTLYRLMQVIGLGGLRSVLSVSIYAVPWLYALHLARQADRGSLSPGKSSGSQAPMLVLAMVVLLLWRNKATLYVAFLRWAGS